MKKILLSFVLILLSLPAVAEDLKFYIIQPEGEGDTDSAKPYLAELFDYIKETTGTAVTGLYLNDSDEALEALKKKEINLAIVNPLFFDKYQEKFQLIKILQTIPIYSMGPYEKYYIMAQKDVDVTELMEKNAKIDLYSSKTYEDNFLNTKIFVDNEEIKKISWLIQATPKIVDTIKKITEGKTNSFVLLTGYEFSVVNNLKKTNAAFGDLKLVYSSQALPSSALVSVGTGNAEIEKIKESLLSMSISLKGNLILKKLRLKGFAGM